MLKAALSWRYIRQALWKRCRLLRHVAPDQSSISYSLKNLRRIGVGHSFETQPAILEKSGWSGGNARRGSAGRPVAN
ncbi:MAG: hypothetical protein IPL99_14800 [Candidatus Competibacteraceae bacterium]|nr:hypothetical protein [Candidatus Competibacteraceae bacterium]